MFTISELKMNGKAAFRYNYWKCVLVAIILTAITATGASSATGGTGGATISEMISQASAESGIPFGILSIGLASLLGVGLILGILISLFVTNPFIVGCNIFYLDNAQGNAYLGNLIWAYKNNFVNTVIAMLLRTIFTAIGFIFFIIPGIYLLYSYRLVPFVLADHPEMSPTEVLRESKRLMNGYKIKSFLLDLSFIGWDILNIFTLNLLSIFYVAPYKYATEAELYRAIRAYDR